MKTLPSQERLQKAFKYNPLTGDVTITDAKTRKYIHRNYWVISIDGQRYQLSRCIWLYCTGIDPAELQIDHIDKNPQNNCLYNLRTCTVSQNLQNRGVHKRNKLGIKGVFCSYWDTKSGRKVKYRAQIGINNKQIFLGCFETAEQAQAAYCIAAKVHHKEFASLN